MSLSIHFFFCDHWFLISWREKFYFGTPCTPPRQMNNQASGVTLTHRQNVLFSFFIDLSIVSSGRNSSSKKKKKQFRRSTAKTKNSPFSSKTRTNHQVSTKYNALSEKLFFLRSNLKEKKPIVKKHQKRTCQCPRASIFQQQKKRVGNCLPKSILWIANITIK